MRIALSGGGTGGHVYPILAVAAALEAPPFSIPRESFLFLGSRGRAEEALAQRSGLPFAAIDAGAVVGRSPAGLARSSIAILRGIFQAWGALGRFRPAALFATGGYVSVPAVVAAWFRGIPTLLYLPDVEPGLAVRFLAFFARRVAVTAPPPSSSLPHSKVVATGYPVRPGFDTGDRAAAQARYGLQPDRPTLLVWGGSQGARPINQAVAENLEPLLEVCQIIHVCGPADAEWLQERRDALDGARRERYHLFPYLYEGVPEAMAGADLAVSRAGASVLGEFTVSGLPAVLVPYPYAAGHQMNNARYLADAGAAVALPEERLGDFLAVVTGLLKDEARLTEMAARARALARPDAARRIAALLVSLARNGAGAGLAAPADQPVVDA